MRFTNCLWFISLALTGCLSGPGFMKQSGAASISSNSGTKDAAIVSDADGIVTATLDPNSGSSQLVAASSSSAIAGSSISFPPGSVGIATDITLEEGVSLASDSVAQELGVADSGALSQAGPAVVISSSASTDATQPFTVSLVLGGSSLYLQDEGKELVVVYKIKKASDGSTYVGVIPKDEVRRDGNVIAFEASHFGSYQAVYTKVVLQRSEKPSNAPIVTKRDEANVVASDVDSLNVVKTTATSIELKWTPVAKADGYLGRKVEGTSIDAACRDNDGKTFEGRDNTKAVVDDLKPNTSYTFRICTYQTGAQDSVGKIVTAKTLAAPKDSGGATDTFVVQAMPVSSARVQIQWTNTNGTVIPQNNRYLVAIAEGTKPPATCAGGKAVLGGFAESPRYAASTKLAIRVCSAPTDATMGSGVVTTAQTQAGLAGLCDSGSTDTTCVINANKTLPANFIIAGTGNLSVNALKNIYTTASAGGMPNRLDIDMAGSVNILGTLNVDGRGYPGGVAGAGPGGGRSAANGGTGGGFGGEGGHAADALPNQIASFYGDVGRPSDGPYGQIFGSGGYRPAPASGSDGGGAVRIRAGNLSVGGNIYASGLDGQINNGIGGAGGSGGSIYLEANKLNISGVATLSASGGIGKINSGGGSGGRIAIHCLSNLAADCIIASDRAFATGGGNSAGNAVLAGAAGTIFTKIGTKATLEIVGSSNAMFARTPFDANYYPYSSVKIISARAFLMKPQFTGKIGTFVVGSGGFLDNSGMGGEGGKGGDGSLGPSSYPMAGQGPNNSSSPSGGHAAQIGVGGSGGGGGGHGSAGGDGSQNTSSGGAAYDMLAPPSLSAGSGGGGGSGIGARGGNGGGFIRLIVNTMTVEDGGLVLASGAPGQPDISSSFCGGGGSGGSIWITADTYNAAANNSFHANGGLGTCGFSPSGKKGGGGAGGMILLEGSDLGPAVCSVTGNFGDENGGTGLKQGC